MENTVKKPTDKICPLAPLSYTEVEKRQKCLGEKCALYVKIVKSRELKAGDCTYSDPETYLKFEGCGLIKNIPWVPVKIPEKKAESAR